MQFLSKPVVVNHNCFFFSVDDLILDYDQLIVLVLETRVHESLDLKELLLVDQMHDLRLLYWTLDEDLTVAKAVRT
jgi:hypothetical protein